MDGGIKHNTILLLLYCMSYTSAWHAMRSADVADG